MIWERGSIILKSNISVLGFSAVAGEMEQAGPLQGKFDRVFSGDTDGKKTFEQAESQMQLCAAQFAIEKSNLSAGQIGVAFAGDLLNQCIGSSYGLCSLKIPFLGLYGACSTMAESLVVASVFLESNAVQTALAVTSSHFCAAERQFRFPLEYGGQRPLSAQWTATAAGAVVLGRDFENFENECAVKIKAVCIGRICDLGVKDINNMGAEMAPAAADTITTFFKQTATSAEDYDIILTGDLGEIGSTILNELVDRAGFAFKGRHQDCGLLLFDRNEQDVHAGGSGCGCSAAVLCADVLNRLKAGKLHRVLFVATGALMSTKTNKQGETIPSIAHLVLFESE